MSKVLEIANLRLSFHSYQGTVDVLHGISLNIDAGERVALVGESGSGKSVTARIILGILQELHSAKVTGDIIFEGQKLKNLSQKSRHKLRGTSISIIFQDPTSSLNPVFTIGTQFDEVLKRKNLGTKKVETRKYAGELLNSVYIQDHTRVLNSYPFQLSGGMNQRVSIAMALANQPSLLIADEPGTALDVTIQSQTLKLMHELVEQSCTAVLFISHNLGVVREFADRVYVIYRGRIVEEGRTEQVFENPCHAYTQALMSAVPKITGGGISYIPDRSEDFFAPAVIHK